MDAFIVLLGLVVAFLFMVILRRLPTRKIDVSEELYKLISENKKENETPNDALIRLLRSKKGGNS